MRETERDRERNKRRMSKSGKQFFVPGHCRAHYMRLKESRDKFRKRRRETDTEKGRERERQTDSVLTAWPVRKHM